MPKTAQVLPKNTLDIAKNTSDMPKTPQTKPNMNSNIAKNTPSITEH